MNVPSYDSPSRRGRSNGLLLIAVLSSCAAWPGCSSQDGGGKQNDDTGVDVTPPDDDAGIDAKVGVFDDDDGDGYANTADNCPELANPGQADVDNDSSGDVCDNCVPLPNYDQKDSDGDGEGDVCESAILSGGDNDRDGVQNQDDLCVSAPDPQNLDTDKDSWGDACDNCPKAANTAQTDTDGDGKGDRCDEDGPISDADGDGVPDDKDNCPKLSNPSVDDFDKDGFGDFCDNCPTRSNFQQIDSDGNGMGDVCQGNPSAPDPMGDTDADGVLNKDDKCPALASADNNDADGDGHGDPCDNCKRVANSNQAAPLSATDLLRCNAVPPLVPSADADGDGVINSEDKCPGTPTGSPITAQSQRDDSDGDGVGNGCDNCPNVANFTQNAAACALPDTDGDGRPNGMDNCRGAMNADQADTDADGVGNVCDNCPTTANVNQANGDTDAIGDACDPSPGTFTVCASGTTTVSAIKPDLYFLLDRSLSMSPAYNPPGDDRLATLKTALNTLAAQNGGALASNFNLGVGAFPSASGSCGGADLPQQLLGMGAHTTAEFTGSYAPIATAGFTPTDVALQRVLALRLMDFVGDPSPTGPKAVVLITDGEPNDCTQQGANTFNRIDQTVTAAAALATAGIPVYLLGFTGVQMTLMQRIANAGDPAADPNVWYNVSSTTDIVNALNSIIRRTTSCTMNLTNTGATAFDPNVITVDFVQNNGATRTAIARDPVNGYTLSGTTLTLAGTSCSALQTALATDATARIDIKAGCQCTSSGSEICDDNIDNNCNGLIDEGCIPTNRCGVNAPPTSCPPVDPPVGPPEICDGIDNDNDNQIDEGCPGTCMMATDEVCDGKDNDCDGELDEGCPPVCTPEGEICDGRDNDCDTLVDEGCDNRCRPLTEICDGLDNDCNGLVDEICPTIPDIG